MLANQCIRFMDLITMDYVDKQICLMGTGYNSDLEENSRFAEKSESGF